MYLFNDAVNLSLNFKFKLLLFPNFQRSFSVLNFRLFATHLIGVAKVKRFYISTKFILKNFKKKFDKKIDVKNC
ncbi:MAG: hypothetical protein RL596_1061 [Bacteroidota bacterium]|jgi:hypothetical protein